MLLDPSTDKVIGDEDQAFVRQLSLEVTLLLPGHYLDFKDIPEQYKDQVVQKMKVNYYLSYFHIIVFQYKC